MLLTDRPDRKGASMQNVAHLRGKVCSISHFPKEFGDIKAKSGNAGDHPSRTNRRSPRSSWPVRFSSTSKSNGQGTDAAVRIRDLYRGKWDAD
jgi:hypothetical protein